MAILISIPLFALVTVLQSTILSRMPLLQGSADLFMLVVIAWALQERVRTAWHWSLIAALTMGFVSILPYYVPLITYLGITALTLAIRRRIWQQPLLAMVVITLTGGLFSHIISAIALRLSGTVLPWLDVLQLITLPSLLLNLLLSLPVYVVIRDIAQWVYPEEIEL